MSRFRLPAAALFVPWIVALAVALGTLAGDALATTEQEVWLELKESLFEDRPILAGEGVIRLEAPYRAYDAAIVPITMAAEMPQTPGRYIKTITLIIDNNPAPVAAVFGLTPLSGTATISTRVRINAYGHVRAVAETNDGKLYMAAKFVKASAPIHHDGVYTADLALPGYPCHIRPRTRPQSPGCLYRWLVQVFVVIGIRERQ